MSVYRSTFISHAHADNALCDRYVAALRARGIELWYDRENAQSGHLLGDMIQRELEHRSACVVLLTQNALDSFWVKLEIQTYLGLLAKDPSRVLLPVRIGPCTVPAMLNAFLWIDALEQPFERTIEAIATALAMGAASPEYAHVPPITPPTPLTPAQPGPAPAPHGAKSASHLTPLPPYNLGCRGWEVNGVECILPPLCPVPGGVFTMGSDKSQDREALNSETPQYPVDVAAFSIGQHPVTVAEYACAVRAKAVPEPPGGRTGEDWQTQLGRLDHPVVCVSWRSALAYTRWLAEITGQPWRLSTEAEWEKAARWDAAHEVSCIYPWGDAFDNARCNTSESGIGSTTPVGHYPTGASPYGAQDMAGNVWEWVSSLDRPYPYRQDDGREDITATGDRVLRGGSWYGNPGDARAACSYHAMPEGVLSFLGFRLAWSAAAGA